MLLLLLGFSIIAGITAKDAAAMQYAMKNSSLCLHVAATSKYNNPLWKFNGRAVVLNGITTNSRGKLDYYPNNHSLCINKLTETESGIYIFSFFDSDFKETTETHRIMVEEAVPTPAIRMSGLHFNLSAGFCNVTVNCSVQDDWMFSVCDKDGCSTSQRLLRKVNITIFTDSTSIVCRGNNYVSTSNVSESIQATCLQKDSPKQEETSEQLVLIILVIIIVSLCVFAGCVAKGLCSSQYNRNYQAEVSASQPTQNQSVEAPLQHLPRVSASTSSQAQPCYKNVGATQHRHASTPTVSPREELGSTQSQQVDTVYSYLQVPKVAPSLEKSDSDSSKGQKEVQEASASLCVSQNEAELSAQIDTVYSVLQQPKNKSQHPQ